MIKKKMFRNEFLKTMNVLQLPQDVRKLTTSVKSVSVPGCDTTTCVTV